MRAVVRRIDRLEDQFGSANGKPRRRLRMMISMAGPYEITAPLGAGSMGEVYRARDSKLGHDVGWAVTFRIRSSLWGARTRSVRTKCA
jgi:serine/threonine protein kinase